MLTLLATGGTIAAVASPHGLLVGADAAALLARAAQVWPLPDEVATTDVTGLASSALSVRAVLDLARTVHDSLTRSTGVVITHGTDALEETAFLLSLVHGGEEPVVLTGAQRPFDDPAPDGPRNLAAALAWAASPLSTGTGVTVTFADQVLPAVGVHKAHTLGVDAFAAPGRGAIGTVDVAGVRRHAHPARGPAFVPLGTTDLPRVDVLPQHLGADATFVDAALAAGAEGLVVMGLGAGNTPPAVTRRVVEAVEGGVPVLLASRTGSGAVAGLYAGGGSDLVAAGAVPAGDLSPWQARLLLAAVLGTPTAEPGTWADRTRAWLTRAGATAPSR